MENPDKKKFFSMTFSEILTLLALCGGLLGVWGTLNAEVTAHRVEIANIKDNAIKKEVADRETREEVKANVKEVKQEVKDINLKIDRLFDELRRQGRERR